MSSQQRSTDRRKVIVSACLDLLLEVGAESLTHRMIAERADVPLGSTTYYFSSLDELVQEALHLGAQDTQNALTDLEQKLTANADIPGVLTSTLEGYIKEREQLQIWGEFNMMASHRAEFRPFVNLWKDGLVRILSQHMSEESALTIAVFIDGVQLHALVDDKMPNADMLNRTFKLLIR